jgi:peptide/nickel transport system ATP-binding protein
MDKILKLKNITKVFYLGSLISRFRITAVNHVSFHVHPTEIFGLAGESGCGKTTIARMILGFEEPTSGRITYRRNDDTQGSRRGAWQMAGIQAIFQNSFQTFNPLRQVERYFLETLHNFDLTQGREEPEGQIDEALKTVGLSYSEITGRYPSEFSGGQLQRLSIARALLTEPYLLIADEPVSMVDASLRMSIVNLFRKLKEERGMSVIYITHDLATAYYVCDRIAIMFRGNIVEMGKAEEVLLRPRHPYTKLLRECIPETEPKQRWKRKTGITELEREEYLREGCKFAGRCPYVMDKCKHEVPPDLNVDGVFLKCFLYVQR